MSCNHQLNTLILVQNKYVFQENKAPIVAPRYTESLPYTHMTCVLFFAVCHLCLLSSFHSFVFIPYCYMMQVFPH